MYYLLESCAAIFDHVLSSAAQDTGSILERRCKVMSHDVIRFTGRTFHGLYEVVATPIPMEKSTEFAVVFRGEKEG